MYSKDRFLIVCLTEIFIYIIARFPYVLPCELNYAKNLATNPLKKIHRSYILDNNLNTHVILSKLI